MVQSMENEVIFASMFEKELYGLQTTDVVMSICFKALAETLATVQAICMSGYPRLGFQTCKSEDMARKLRIIDSTTDMTTNNGCYMPFGSELCSSSRESSTIEEYYSPSSSLEGPDTTVRVKNEEIREWLSVAKNKDDDDDDEDEDEDDDEDEDENDANDDEEEGADEDDEGEEGLQGGPPGDQAGGDEEDEDEEEEEDDDDGKGDEEDEEDEEEDGVEGEEDEDEEDEDEDDEDDEEDETPEPPQKKRK